MLYVIATKPITFHGVRSKGLDETNRSTTKAYKNLGEDKLHLVEKWQK